MAYALRATALCPVRKRHRIRQARPAKTRLRVLRIASQFRNPPITATNSRLGWLSCKHIMEIVRFPKSLQLVSLQIGESGATKSQIDQKSCDQILPPATNDHPPERVICPTCRLHGQVVCYLLLMSDSAIMHSLT